MGFTESFVIPPFASHRSTSVITQRYNVPSSSHFCIKIHEKLTESPYAFLTAIALLRAFRAEQASILKDLEEMANAFVPAKAYDFERDILGVIRCSCGGKCKLPDNLKVIRQRQVLAHQSLQNYYSDCLSAISEKLTADRPHGERVWLRKSIEKKDEDLQWVALTCCVQEVSLEESISGESTLPVGATLLSNICRNVAPCYDLWSARCPRSGLQVTRVFGTVNSCLLPCTI